MLHVFSCFCVQNNEWRVQEEKFARTRATARVVFYYLNTRRNTKKMVNLDEENLATTSTDDNGTPATTTTTTTMMTRKEEEGSRDQREKQMRERLKAQAYLGEQYFLAEHNRRKDNKKYSDNNDWFSTEDETFVVATKASNPKFPPSAFAQFSENENVVQNNAGGRRRDEHQHQHQHQQKITTTATKHKQLYFSPPQNLEDIQGTLPSQNGVASHMVCQCDEASQYVTINPDARGKWEGEGGRKQYAQRCPVHFPFAWTWKGDVNTGPMKGEAWMSAARMRDQRAKEVAWEARELERRRLALRSIYDRENKHHPMNYELKTETNEGHGEEDFEKWKDKKHMQREKPTMFTRVVDALESIGHNLFGDDDDDEYYDDDDDEGRTRRRNNEKIVRDVHNAREFAQFVRDEGALKYLSSNSSSPRKISEKVNKNPNGIVDRSMKQRLLDTSKSSVRFSQLEGEPGYVVYETNFNYYVVTHDASLSNWIYAKLDRTSSRMRVEEGGRKRTEAEMNAFFREVRKNEGTVTKLSAGAGLVVFIEFAGQEEGLTVDSVEVEDASKNPEGIILRDELKFREKMRRMQEFNLNYLHIERVYPDKWGANGAQFGVKKDYVVFSGADSVRVPSKANAERAALMNMHLTVEAADFAEESRLQAKDREEVFKARLLINGGEVLDRHSGSGSNQKWVYKNGRKLKKIANAKPKPPPSYGNKDFRGNGPVVDSKSSSSKNSVTNTLIGSLEQSLFGKQIADELLEEDDELSFWEGTPVGVRILPDFVAHSYIKPGDVRKVKRLNMQIYRTKLLSETESIANFFVPLLETVLKAVSPRFLKMNNNNDEYVKKEANADENTAETVEYLDEDEIDIVQKYLYSDSRIPLGTRLVKLRFRSYSRHESDPIRVQ